MIRLSAEHVAGYGRDCAHLVYALLFILDRDVIRSEQTFTHGKLADIAERLSAVGEQLFSIRRDLGDLRYSPEVKDRLDAALADELQALRELDQSVAYLVGRAALLSRAQLVSQLVSLGAPDFEAAAQTVRTGVRNALEAVELESDGLSKAVQDALTALRAAHRSIPFDEADEIEHRRWRE
jgi:hypothetical protein